MIPILFSADATAFTTNGIGRLSDAISCTVHEARNGEFELEMTYPMDGAHYSNIVHSAIIVAKPSARRDPQAFRIYKISKPMRGTITINAQHISYQLSYIPVMPFSAASLATALSGFASNAAESCPFTLTADFTSNSSYAVPLPTSIRSYLGGKEGSILDVYGGEWEWDNYSCILHESRGQDNGYMILYGKNLVDLTQEQSIENTYTGICPYWQGEAYVDGEEDDGSTAETMVTLSEKVVHASTASNFPFQRTLVMDFSDKFDNAPTEAQLRAYTNAYITANDIGIPNVNLSIDFVNLADTVEYKSLLTTANIDLCDTVTVRFEKLGVDVQSKVVDIVWNVLQDRYDSIEIGDKRSTLATTIEEQMESISVMPTTAEVARRIDRATGILNAGTAGHVVINRNEEGWANEILFLDNENLASAQNVLRINKNGIGFSSEGYGGPYYQSWTIDAILSLGGLGGQYGELRILDPDGVILCAVTKDGYTVYDEDGETVIGQWSHDGISLNKGLINFQWDNGGTDAVGFYADGTKVQIGDWIIDSESYGRGIIQSTDEVTGMSADPGDEDLLYLWAGYNSESDYRFVVNGSDAYVMYNGTPYPIGQSLATLNNAVSAYIQDIESGGDDDGDEEGDGTSGTGETTSGGYLQDGELINDLEP